MAREMPNYGNGRGSAEANETIQAARGADASLAEALAPQLSMDTGDEQVAKAAPGLADKFVVPPFSVLDTRAGYWQERRRAWLSLGMRSEVGREGNLTFRSGVNGDPAFYTRKAAKEKELGRTLTTEEFTADHYDRDALLAGASGSMRSGTSVFDPVLCEIAYRWFVGTGATVVDPFAGGVVRGLLAGVLGRAYHGVELRPEQVADNREQAATLLGGGLDFGREPIMPRWYEGDAVQLHDHGLPRADLIFTCPPYADLEVYSDDPRDLSTMHYEVFRQAYGRVMVRSAELLKPDRFAVWVVGEARDKAGLSYGLIADTVRAARVADMALYNEAILLNPIGTAMLRAQAAVRASRKLTRVHQHVLVFVKGDPKKAAAACGSAEVEA